MLKTNVHILNWKLNVSIVKFNYLLRIWHNISWKMLLNIIKYLKKLKVSMSLKIKKMYN